MTKKSLLFLISLLMFFTSANAQEHNEADKSEHTATEAVEKYDPTPNIMNHIANTHEFHLFGHYSIPLPCIVYEKDAGGVKTFMSSVFEHGEKSYEGYISDHGVMKRVKDLSVRLGQSLAVESKPTLQLEEWAPSPLEEPPEAPREQGPEDWV